jgi:tight adherence protein C
MTLLLIFLGAGLAGVSGWLATHAVAMPRLRLKRSLLELAEYGFVSGGVGAKQQTNAGIRDALTRLAERVGRFTRTRVPALPVLGTKDLAAAGYYDITVDVVHGYRVLAAAGLGMLMFLLGVASISAPVVAVLLAVGAAALGWQLPSTSVKRRGRKRLEEIDAELPELIDLMIATIESGMAFGASLGLVADRLQGPLGDEVRLTGRQQNLGISTAQALEDMLERCDTPSMAAFVRTVVRGESMGLSIAPILRELTQDMRRRRRQAAQERMHKAPVKILFPLMFLIMPALFIVLFYPAAYSIMTGLSGIG